MLIRRNCKVNPPQAWKKTKLICRNCKNNPPQLSKLIRRNPQNKGPSSSKEEMLGAHLNLSYIVSC